MAILEMAVDVTAFLEDSRAGWVLWEEGWLFGEVTNLKPCLTLVAESVGRPTCLTQLASPYDSVRSTVGGAWNERPVVEGAPTALGLGTRT